MSLAGAAQAAGAPTTAPHCPGSSRADTSHGFRRACLPGPRHPGGGTVSVGAQKTGERGVLCLPFCGCGRTYSYYRERRDSCVSWSWALTNHDLYLTVVRQTCIGCLEFDSSRCDVAGTRLAWQLNVDSSLTASGFSIRRAPLGFSNDSLLYPKVDLPGRMP